MPITPNMTLDLPSVSVTLGPEWATLLNAAFALVDSHDHSAGKGVKVTQLGLNITDDLEMNEQYLTEVGSMRLVSQAATLVTPQDLRSIYSVLGDLYYNNGSGTPIQITSGGSVTAASDGISRQFSRTSVNSNTVISAAGTTSYYDVDTTSGVTFTLPSAAGVAAGRFYEFKDTTGSAGTNNIVINRAGSDTIDGATSLTVSYNYGGVRLISDGTSKWSSNEIKANEIATTMIKDAAITPAKMAALGQQSSASSGTYSTTSATFVDVTNLSVSITTTGRPVFVGLLPSSSSNAYLNCSSSSNSSQAIVQFLRGSTEIGKNFIGIGVTGATTTESFIPGSIFYIDAPAAGTYTYKVQVRSVTASTTTRVFHLNMIAYEL